MEYISILTHMPQISLICLCMAPWTCLCLIITVGAKARMLVGAASYLEKSHKGDLYPISWPDTVVNTHAVRIARAWTPIDRFASSIDTMLWSSYWVSMKIPWTLPQPPINRTLCNLVKLGPLHHIALDNLALNSPLHCGRANVLLYMRWKIEFTKKVVQNANTWFSLVVSEGVDSSNWTQHNDNLSLVVCIKELKLTEYLPWSILAYWHTCHLTHGWTCKSALFVYAHSN